jgi:hypothetical protein
MTLVANKNQDNDKSEEEASKQEMREKILNKVNPHCENYDFIMQTFYALDRLQK